MRRFIRILPFLVAALLFPARVGSAQTTWTNAGTTGMWTNNIWSGPVAGYPNGLDSIALFNGATLAASASRGITNDVSITNGSLVFVNTTNTGTGFNLWTNNGTARLYLDVSSGNATIVNATNVGSGANQILVPITMLDALLVSNNGTLSMAGDIDAGGNAISVKGGGATTISRSINNGSTLTKGGTGSLILGGSNNSFSGGITLDSGSLGIASSARKSGIEAAFGSATITANGGVLDISADNFNGLIITNPLVLNGDLTVKGSGQNQSWLAPISGGGRLILTNTSALISILNLYTNTYSGGTVVSNTQLGLNGNLALGTGPVTIYTATFSGGTTGLSISNNFTLLGSATFTANMPAYLGTWDLNGGTRSLIGTPGSGNSVWLMGALSNGTANFIKGNANLLTFQLGGSNTVAGTTLVDGAALALASNAGSMVSVTNFVLNAGTLALDNRSGVPAFSRVNTAAGVTLTNATLQIIGPGITGQLFTQQVGAVSLNFGANALQVTNRGTFLADTLSRAVGATLNVNGTNAPTVYVANAPAGMANGIVPWAVINAGASGFAGWTNGALAIYLGYTNTLLNDASANVRIGTATLAAPSTLNSLWVSNSAASVNLGGNTLAIASGGLLFGTNTGSSVSNGVVNFGTSEGVVYNDATASVYATVGGSGGLTKSGAGALSLLGTNTYTGDTRVNQGSLILQGGVISNSGNVVLVQGSAFQMIGGSVDVNSLQSPSNWLGTLPTVTLSSGDLVTRSNSSAYTGTLGQGAGATATTWTMLGGSNYVAATFATNMILRATGSNTVLVMPGVTLGGIGNRVSLENGASFNGTVAASNVKGSNSTLIANGTNSRVTLAQFGVAGFGARLVFSNGAVAFADRGVVGATYSGSADPNPYTNSELIVSASTFDLNLNAASLAVGGAAGAVSNRITVSDGGILRLTAGNGAVGFTVGTGATSSYNVAEISGGSLFRYFTVTTTPISIGNTNAGGTGNALIVRDGSTFEVLSSALTNSIRVVGTGNVFSNISSTFQVGGGGTVGIFITNTPGSIVFTNTVLSWVNRSDSYATPILAGTTLTNVTWQGNNGFMLNGASNATGLVEYTFDSVANTGTATNFQRLLLAGTNSLWRSARLNIAAGGEMIVTNAAGTARVQGIVTNAGTITVLNSSLAFASNTVISGGLVSDPSTITFQSNATVTASGYINATNDTYVFWRDFFNQSTNTALFRMNLATALFTNGAGVTTHALVLSNSAALDLGHFTNFGMVASNLSIGTLSIAPGNRLILAGNKDSQTNALYVGWLDIQGLTLGSTNSYLAVSNTLVAALNLPNINLYYDVYDTRNDWLTRWLPPVAGAGYDLWGGGLLLPIPEPSPFLALGSGLALLLFLRRRKAS